MRIRIAFVHDGIDFTEMPLSRAICDEFSEDIWGGLPDYYRDDLRRAEEEGSIVREVFVDIPDATVSALFETPVVPARVGGVS